MNCTNDVRSFEAEKRCLCQQIAILTKYDYLTSERRSNCERYVQTSFEMIAEIKSKISKLDKALVILKSG